MAPKWFAWIGPLVALLAMLSLIPFALLYYARATNSPVPRISIIPDMDNQQRFKAQQANPLFADDRAMRPQVAGSVAAGMQQADDFFYRGISGGQWATAFPPQVALNAELLNRGRERYGIYCAACHGLAGDGDGMVSKRAEDLAEGMWIPPVSYHSATVRSRPLGHIFNTISNGIRTMPAYGTQIPPEDRWAIVAYVRALQRSRHATLSDVPADKRAVLEAQAAAEAATTAGDAKSAQGAK
jgi:mono/diheme cytochrome c family protein